MDFLNAVVIGVITGVFTAGTVWGILRTELKFLRRDVDEVRRVLGFDTPQKRRDYDGFKSKTPNL